MHRTVHIQGNKTFVWFKGKRFLRKIGSNYGVGDRLPVVRHPSPDRLYVGSEAWVKEAES